MDDSRIPKKVFYWQLHRGFRRPGWKYKRYMDCLKTTLNRCSITPSELETFAMDRTDLHSSCKSWKSSKHDASRSWSLNRVCASLVHHPPATLSARSATGCIVHGSGFLPTTSSTCGDETRRVDGSVRDCYQLTASVAWTAFCNTITVHVCGF